MSYPTRIVVTTVPLDAPALRLRCDTLVGRLYAGMRSAALSHLEIALARRRPRSPESLSRSDGMFI
jgi:hypothetical protein